MDEELAVRNLREAKEILDMLGIKYWLDWGTLLGAVRDGKIIEWDHDIDLGAMRDSWEKILSIIHKFEESGFYTERGQLGGGVSFARFGISLQIFLYQTKGEDAFIPYPAGKLADLIARGLGVLGHLRLFPEANIWIKLRLIKAKALRYFLSLFMSKKPLFNLVQGRGGIKFRQIIIPKYYFGNLATIEFYGMKFNIPSDTESYLKYHYGEDWRTPKREWDAVRDDGSFRLLRERGTNSTKGLKGE